MQKLQRSPRGIILPLNAQRTPIRLANGARNLFLTIIARARVTIAGAAATEILNRGSACALADRIILDENGTDRMIVNGKVLRFASEMNAPSALTAKRLTSTAIGVTQLEEAMRLMFTFPLANNPLDTTFVERDVRQALDLVVQRVADPNVVLATAGGGGTVVVDQIGFTIIQGFESPGQRGVKAPYFLPSIKEQTFQVNGANVEQIEYIKTNNPLRMLILSQEVAGVEVSDIVTQLALLGDYRPIIGPAQMDVDDVLLDSEFDFGGAVISTNRAHVGFNFQRYGQLSEVLNPAQDTNLRLSMTTAPSARAGQSLVRLTSFELLRDPVVTAKDVPFPY